MIYKVFKIANQQISTKLVDMLPDGEYGRFNHAKNQILLAKKIEFEDEIVELTQEQIKNTFYHEVIHAFQFYYNNSFDESQAQVYANFLREMFDTGIEIEI